MRIFKLATIFYVFSLCILTADNFAGTIVNSKEGFSITLPENWEQISKSEADKNKDLNNVMIYRYDYLYKAQSGNDKLDFPYILIQYIKDDDVNSNAVFVLAKQKTDSMTPEYFLKMGLELVISKKHTQVWMKNQIPTMDNAEITEATVFIPGQKCSFVVHVYYKSGQSAESISEVFKITESIKLFNKHIDPFYYNNNRFTLIGILLIGAFLLLVVLYVSFNQRVLTRFKFLRRRIFEKHSIFENILNLIKTDFILFNKWIFIFTSILILPLLPVYLKEHISIFNYIFSGCTLIPFFYYFKNPVESKNRLLKSLPVSSKAIIADHYVLNCFFYIFYVVFLQLLFVLILSLFDKALTFSQMEYYANSTVKYLSIYTLNIAILIPIIICYGARRVLIFAFLFANIILWNFDQILIHSFLSILYLNVSLSLKNFFGNYAYFMINTFGEPVFYLSIALVLFIITYISYRISLYLFKKKEV